MYKNNNVKFSVLMSVYKKEKPNNLRECFESLLLQTVKADEWVMVKDGPLTRELDDVIEEYQIQYPNLIKCVELSKNRGLGLALREGILHCSNELIARMDTDDICVYNRFEKQLIEFEKNPTIHICGTYIEEFEDETKQVVSVRKVPLHQEEIKKYQIYRSSFNHVSVMFKKTAVLHAGNYQDALFVEDDLLWVNMLNTGSVGVNIAECLVRVRVGKELIKRRGGYSYYKQYKSGRKKIRDTGFINERQYCISLLIQLMVCLVPNSIRRKIFINLLRKE